MFKVVLCQRSFPLILRDVFVQQPPKCQNYNFDKIMQKKGNNFCLLGLYIAFYAFSISSPKEMKHPL